jgi:hypothetical protein
MRNTAINVRGFERPQCGSIGSEERRGSPNSLGKGRTCGLVAVFALSMAAWFMFGWLGSTCCQAHPGFIASGEAKVQPNGHFVMTVHFDLLAYTLNDNSFRIGQRRTCKTP